jgi:uncharacterized protein YhhL (DUF1145 family)
MNFYDVFLICLLIVKLIFVFAVIKNRIAPSEKTKKIVDITHKIFTGLMACLLIYLFNPRKSNSDALDKETKLFLFVFGILTLVDLYKH